MLLVQNGTRKYDSCCLANHKNAAKIVFYVASISPSCKVASDEELSNEGVCCEYFEKRKNQSKKKENFAFCLLHIPSNNSVSALAD